VLVLAEKVIKMFIDIHNTKNGLEYECSLRHIIKHWVVGVLLLLNSVTTFSKTWTLQCFSKFSILRTPKTRFFFKAF